MDKIKKGWRTQRATRYKKRDPKAETWKLKKEMRTFYDKAKKNAEIKWHEYNLGRPAFIGDSYSSSNY